MDANALVNRGQVKALIRSALRAFLREQFVDITGAYTLTAADLGKTIRCTGTFTITVPTAAAQIGPIQDGFKCNVINRGSGVITIAGSGITFERSGTTLAQHSAATIMRHATDVWGVYGKLAA